MRRDLTSALLLGLALVGAGVLVSRQAGTAPPAVAHSGSYAPLTATDAYGGGRTGGWAVTWTTGSLVGAALAVLGLLVLAAVGGWVLGRRSRLPATPA
ncbi:hypothetical protein SAMN05660690_3301 [Geodermatophilus telluris]|uniref:Uncharacterized protein n=1 Tax=Geodermatophilus telluris TaxID=1190417 RepID=A0A1G6RT93_9ACTN|nr:hypothetical protein [Geodermatophilus telluris]SDD07176.1 hypothetical protein SAMN05660690_3301 [Geodermatophilus telluris]